MANKSLFIMSIFFSFVDLFCTQLISSTGVISCYPVDSFLYSPELCWNWIGSDFSAVRCSQFLFFMDNLIALLEKTKKEKYFASYIINVFMKNPQEYDECKPIIMKDFVNKKKNFINWWKQAKTFEERIKRFFDLAIDEKMFEERLLNLVKSLPRIPNRTCKIIHTPLVAYSAPLNEREREVFRRLSREKFTDYYKKVSQKEPFLVNLINLPQEGDSFEEVMNKIYLKLFKFEETVCYACNQNSEQLKKTPTNFKIKLPYEKGLIPYFFKKFSQKEIENFQKKNLIQRIEFINNFPRKMWKIINKAFHNEQVFYTV